jgi:adenylate cyclase
MAKIGKRKLVGIVFVDVVGYSKLIEARETATIVELRAHRRELIDPTIKEFSGRIVKTIGDGLLLEFLSVVDAVQCALALQEGIAIRNREISEDIQFRFRLGVHLGDVIEEEGDLFGNGVNIAARLDVFGDARRDCNL